MCQIVTDYLDITKNKYPDKIAFADAKRELTFKGLYDEAVHVANALIDRDIFKAPILLFVEKSVSLISCFVGVAYSGNFYSPIDTKMPAERVDKILKTLEPAIVITDSEHEEQVRSMADKCEVLIFEELLNQECSVEKVTSIRSRIIDTDILYVLFTSGSTGTPKGVIINHRSVIDFTDWISDCYHFDETTIFANQAQLYFDLSIQDVYAPLRNGSMTILISNRMYTAPVRVWKTILKYNVNTLVWIPSMLSLFANLDILAHTEKASLKTVLFCGEVMPMKQLNYWIRHYPEVTFGNLYGPTECTEACTYYTIDRHFNDDDVLPMGKPCENSDAIIIDEQGTIVTEPGKIGELCIRGTCLSSGYYGDANRTKEVFVQNPANTKYPELIYKTGDLVTYNDYYELVYVCRKDFQIKIRGYRVELGEIEAAASAIDRITYNCCLFDAQNEKIILVYTGDIEETEVNELLAEKLQDYMIPSEYIHREQMLFNINGKVDRKALGNEYFQQQ
ncbi:amino acid adenylation domain-containing protein [Mordavella massiliensis]|uniref:amino acid adenylation domain-containing protein n=1 Tax=Mordavella massiliensis TaxID=1871024 RepID=UPI0021086956|nr:amino acid adenylation domain-containing protein [Mordavella massiliensis]